MEFFDPSGTRAFSASAMLDIKGQSSRSFRQKSFGLSVVASGDETSIAYPVFPGLKRLGDGSPLDTFQHLRLRNGGNDWAYAAMRDAFCHQLVQGLGLPVTSWRPVSVYLDGEFWGMLEMREEQNAQYFEAHYRVDPDDVVILNGVGSVDTGIPGDAQPFLALRSFAETHDLGLPEHYAHVAARMDVENFLLYQVAEICFGNADWPQNNVRVWRQRRPDPFPDRDLVSRGQDGRWRWMVLDVDISYGHPWAGSYSENTLSYALSTTGRPGHQQRLGHLSAPRADQECGSETHVRQHCRRSAQFVFQGDARHPSGRCHEGDPSAGDGGTYPPLAIERKQRHHLVQHSCGDDADIRLPARHQCAAAFYGQPRPRWLRNAHGRSRSAGSGSVRVNRLLLNPELPGVDDPVYPWRGTYFRNVPVALEALPLPGYSFAGWSTPAGVATTTSIELTLPGRPRSPRASSRRRRRQCGLLRSSA